MNTLFYSQGGLTNFGASAPESFSKAFWFNADTEGWAATQGDAAMDMGWQIRNRISSPRTSPHITTLKGKLRTSAFYGAPQVDSYWEWVGTWEDLGQTPGSSVFTVAASYLFRYEMKSTHHASGAARNGAGFLGNDTGSGPFELRTGDGATLIATLSAFTPCEIDRPDSGVYWAGWPSGADQSVSLTPPSWKSVVGTSQSVDTPYQPSDTAIMLRMTVTTPRVEDAGGTAHAHVRMLHNGIIVNGN